MVLDAGWVGTCQFGNRFFGDAAGRHGHVTVTGTKRKINFILPVFNLFPKKQYYELIRPIQLIYRFSSVTVTMTDHDRPSVATLQGHDQGNRTKTKN